MNEEKYIRIKEIIKSLSERPGMFAKDDSFNEISSFLIGYLWGLDMMDKPISLDRQFANWINLKYKLNLSWAWDRIILEKKAKGDEEKAKKELFLQLNAFIDDYFKGYIANQ